MGYCIAVFIQLRLFVGALLGRAAQAAHKRDADGLLRKSSAARYTSGI